MQDSVKNLKTKMVAVIGLDINKVEKITKKTLLINQKYVKLQMIIVRSSNFIWNRKRVIFMSKI